MNNLNESHVSEIQKRYSNLQLQNILSCKRALMSDSIFQDGRSLLRAEACTDFFGSDFSINVNKTSFNHVFMQQKLP